MIFDCQYYKQIFHKDDFWILAVNVDLELFPDVEVNQYGNVTLLGNNLFELEPNAIYHVNAEKTTSKYGVAYRVHTLTRDKPTSVSDVQHFLRTILTANQAQQLITHYPNIIDLIQENRENEIDFKKLKGIGPKSFQKIKQSILENFTLLDVCAKFYDMLSLSMIRKLCDYYASVDKIIYELQKNPYSALYNIDRVGFRTADRILLEIEKETERRLETGEQIPLQWDEPLATSFDRCLNCIRYYLEQNEITDGNTKISIEDLMARVRAYAPEALGKFVECIKQDEFYINASDKTIAIKSTYNIEKDIAAILIAANKNPVLWPKNTVKYNKIDSFELTEEQQSVQKILCENNVVLLQGPAGSGKSSSVKALTNMLEDLQISFAMACPSAKAAKVLKQYTSYDAKTIHRLLEYNGATGGFDRCEDYPLDEDLIIIDESSMLDIYLAHSLLRAINFKRTKLLLIGDHYQLPSVSAGNLFHDLIESKAFPTISLSQIFRYSEGGLIKVATDIRNSKQYLPNDIDDDTPVLPFGKSYCFIPRNQINGVDYVVELYKKIAQNNPLENIMVLAAQNKGDYGATILNNKIQKAINPHTDGGLTVETNEVEVTYYCGDMVMNIVNDYDSIICNEVGEFETDDDNKPIFTTLIANGENGRIVYIVPDNDTQKRTPGMVIKYDDFYIWREKSSLNKIQLAYAESVHKSQGSGCDYVIIFTPRAHTYMLNSALLYVAVTRAKKCAFHIGNLSTVNGAIHKRPNLNRSTNLQELLRQEEETDDDSGD